MMKYKFSGLVLSACAGLAAFGESVTVESNNSAETLGMIKTLKSSFTNEVVLGIPFVKSPSGETNTIDTLIVAGNGFADTIRIWNPNEPLGHEYDAWIEWFEDNSWPAVDKDPPGRMPDEAAKTKIARGNAFWFNDAGSSTVDLVQAGLVKTGATTRVIAGTSVSPKMTALVNPYGMEINAVEKFATGAATGDQLTLMGGAERYEYKDGAWGHNVRKKVKVGSREIWKIVFEPVEKIVVPSGAAFWYISKGGSPMVSWD